MLSSDYHVHNHPLESDHMGWVLALPFIYCYPWVHYLFVPQCSHMNINRSIKSNDLINLFLRIKWISLAVQWLRLRASNAAGAGSIPGRGNKIPHAAWHRQKKKKELNDYWVRCPNIEFSTGFHSLVYSKFCTSHVLTLCQNVMSHENTKLTTGKALCLKKKKKSGIPWLSGG